MSIDLNDVLVFARVYEAGSFTDAARALGAPKSTISRRVAALEERLGARLIERTTRKFRPTEAGTLLYERARRIALALDEAEAAVAELHDRPKGTLRLTAPVDFGSAWLPAMLADFVRQYPEVRVDVELSNRYVDLLAEGFDLAIRAGQLEDSSLIARRLGKNRLRLYAAPSYFADRSEPLQPEELADHQLVLFRAPRFQATLTLSRGAEVRTLEATSRISVHDFTLLRGLLIAGTGIGVLPDVAGGVEVKSGRLRLVLPEWCLGEGVISAVYPSSRHLSASLRAFLDHLTSQLSPPPWHEEGSDGATPSPASAVHLGAKG